MVSTETITCAMCGRQFEEDRGQAACRSCPLSAGCGRVRCPHCGYEHIATPPWVEKLERLLARRRRKEDVA